MKNELPKSFFPLLGYFLKDYKWQVCLFVFLALAAGLWGPFNSVLVKQMINALPHVAEGHGSSLMLSGVLLVLNFIVFDNFTWRGVGYLNYKYQGVIKNKIINTLLSRVMDGSHQFFQDNLSGRIANQVTTFADNVESILHRYSQDFIRGVSMLIGSLIAASTVNALFSLVLFVWFVCFALFSVFMSRRFIHLSDKQAERESLLSGQLVDAIANHGSARLFSRKRFELFRMEGFLQSLLKAFKRKELFAVIMLTVQGAMITVLIASCVFLLIHLYHLGLVNAGDFALILGLSVNLAHMLWYTMWQFDAFNQAYGKCKQSLSALMLPLEVTDKVDASSLTCSQGEIIFDNVTFHYKGTDALFQHLSLTVKEGQKIGLVGYSGSGKTSFVNLILRLYDITDGAISIDGQNIADVTQDSLREHIAMIPQDPSLFHRSLMDNIRYGRIDASDEEVIEAAKKAHAHEFITQLPEGYKSLVGERGIKLSGGQRQRIAIARAVLKDAPFLILDEATSQLDSVTENLIQESLGDLIQNKTTLVIAHRLSTLLHMDRILVFDQGKIVEDGSHDELLQSNGLYRVLWDAQVGGFLGDHQ